VEGPTDDPQVEGLRQRLVKNAFAALMCSRGPAMFFAGDEFCNTQFGNNNAYCQDNIISWLDWNRLEKYKEVHDFARFMIHFRKNHPILRNKTKPAACQLPEISIHNGYPYNTNSGYGVHMIGVMYAGRNAQDTSDDIIFYCMNSYWEPLTLQLPELTNGMEWKIVANTYCEYKDGFDFGRMTENFGYNTYRIPERSTVIFVAE
jgi:glycogen operon protein